MAMKPDMEKYVEMEKVLICQRKKFWRFVMSRPAVRENMM